MKRKQNSICAFVYDSLVFFTVKLSCFSKSALLVTYFLFTYASYAIVV